MTAQTVPPSIAERGRRAEGSEVGRTAWDRFRIDSDAAPAATPRWARLALAGLLAVTAILYIWDLSASGWANAFYSAAAQAGADNWTAFLFGSSDMANSITVDKPPAAIWVMALSVKLFGLNTWSLLVPQALMGVASVAILYLTVRRWFGATAGLMAGAVLALTPIAVLMFRFNNPDALLVLLLIASTYAMTRAVESAATRWLLLAGVLVGFAFLSKSLQAFLVLPAFVAAYAVAAPTDVRRRVRDLFLALAAVIVSGGWWVALVEFWPGDSRPYIGGSQADSALELILGYNGLGRLTGDEAGSVVPGGGRGGIWGEPSWHRMFDASWSGGIAWLLPTATALLVVGLVLSRRQPRTGRLRAGLILWGGWLVVTWAVFSFASGIIHEYYAVALAPAIAAIVGIGSVVLWRLRDQTVARGVLGVVVAGSAFYGAMLLTAAGGGYVALGVVVAIVGVLAGAGLMITELTPVLVRLVIGAALAAVIAGPLAFSVQTAATAHTGSLPSTGPAVAGARGGPGRGPGGMGAPTGFAPPAGTMPGGGTGGPGGAGGLLDAATLGDEIVAALDADAADYDWVAAAIGSQNASGYQLATGRSVMPIGGFNGSDPSPTLAQFQEYVARGRIHYFIGGGTGGPGGGMNGGGSNEITTWVQENFESVTIDGVTLYDLTAGASDDG